MKSYTTLVCLICNTQFQKETRYVKRGEGKFCSLKCSMTYINISATNVTLVCNECGKDYQTTRKKSLYCSKPCSSKATRDRRKGLSNTTRSTLSKLITKALPTGTSQCLTCGWDLTVCDIHHIIPKHKGGTDDFDNLTILCPNCHRRAHKKLLNAKDIKSIKSVLP